MVRNLKALKKLKGFQIMHQSLLKHTHTKKNIKLHYTRLLIILQIFVQKESYHHTKMFSFILLAHNIFLIMMQKTIQTPSQST